MMNNVSFTKGNINTLEMTQKSRSHTTYLCLYQSTQSAWASSSIQSIQVWYICFYDHP